MGEEVGVRRRVRARRAPDRRLIDLDHLVEAVDPLDGVVRAGLRPRSVELVRERLVDDLVDEGRLARARDAGDADELPDREVDVDPLQVVLAGAADAEVAAILGAARRDGDPALAREEVARHRPAVPHHLRRRALGDNLPAVLAGAGPHVHEPVGRAHHLLVVLDDEHGVAEVPEPLEGRDQTPVVPLVEADRRLVEDVEDADQLRPDLRRQPEPLRLAARERARCTVEVEIADADVVEEREPLADLLHDPAADQLLGRREVELVEARERPGDRLLGERVDREPAHGDREHLGLEPRALADRAGAHRHVLLDALALVARVRLAVAPLEVRHKPLERHRVLALAAHPVLVGDEEAVPARAEEEPVLILLLEVAPRRVEVDLEPVGDRLDHRLVEALPAERPGHERALVDRAARVRDEEVGVDLELRAEAGAARAGAVRGVEGEDPRLELG